MQTGVTGEKCRHRQTAPHSYCVLAAKSETSGGEMYFSGPDASPPSQRELALAERERVLAVRERQLEESERKLLQYKDDLSRLADRVSELSGSPVAMAQGVRSPVSVSLSPAAYVRMGCASLPPVAALPQQNGGLPANGLTAYSLTPFTSGDAQRPVGQAPNAWQSSGVMPPPPPPPMLPVHGAPSGSGLYPSPIAASSSRGVGGPPPVLQPTYRPSPQAVPQRNTGTAAPPSNSGTPPSTAPSSVSPYCETPKGLLVPAEMAKLFPSQATVTLASVARVQADYNRSKALAKATPPGKPAPQATPQLTTSALLFATGRGGATGRVRGNAAPESVRTRATSSSMGSGVRGRILPTVKPSPASGSGTGAAQGDLATNVLSTRAISPDGMRARAMRARVAAAKQARQVDVARSVSPHRANAGTLALPRRAAPLNAPSSTLAQLSQPSTAVSTAARGAVGASPPGAPVLNNTSHHSSMSGMPAGTGSTSRMLSPSRAGQGNRSGAGAGLSPSGFGMSGPQGANTSGSSLRSPLVVSVVSPDGVEMWRGSYMETVGDSPSKAGWVCSVPGCSECDDGELDPCPHRRAASPSSGGSPRGSSATVATSASAARRRGEVNREAVSYRFHSPSGSNVSVEWPGAMLSSSKNAGIRAPPMQLHLSQQASGVGQYPTVKLVTDDSSLNSGKSSTPLSAEQQQLAGGGRSESPRVITLQPKHTPSYARPTASREGSPERHEGKEMPAALAALSFISGLRGIQLSKDLALARTRTASSSSRSTAKASPPPAVPIALRDALRSDGGSSGDGGGDGSSAVAFAKPRPSQPHPAALAAQHTPQAHVYPPPTFTPTSAIPVVASTSVISPMLASPMKWPSASPSPQHNKPHSTDATPMSKR